MLWIDDTYVQLRHLVIMDEPVLGDEILVSFLVLRDALVRAQDVHPVGEIEDDVLDHLEVVVPLRELVEILLFLVEVLQDPLADVDLLVDLAVLEELVTEVVAPQRHAALGTGART